MIRVRRGVGCLVAVLCGCLMFGTFSDATEGTKGVETAAQKWLSVIDGGDYAGAWDQSSSLIKGASEKANFAMQVGGTRKPLGKVVKRTLKSSQPQKALPGAPDGQYLVMQFETTFENKKTTVETVTFMQEKDQQWRAAGYYIK